MFYALTAKYLCAFLYLAFLCYKSEDLKYGICNTIIRETKSKPQTKPSPNLTIKPLLCSVIMSFRSSPVSMLCHYDHHLSSPEKGTPHPFSPARHFQQVCMALWFYDCAIDLFCYTTCSNHIKSKTHI